MFKHKSKLNEDNVFTEQEVQMITEYLLNNNPNVISYGIVLGLRSGLRVGELCSLTKSDVTDHCLRINKTETRHRVKNGEYTREIKDNAKTEAGNRFVLIDDVAMDLIEKIKSQNQQSEYLFAINGKRCIGQSFTRKLERACETLGLNPRSMHKCRKTYITTLINANVPESLIIDQVGHTDIRTSKQYYLYNNKARNEALKTLSDAIS
jgi:integrase